MSSDICFVILTFALTCFFTAHASAVTPQCKRFDEIYKNGQELCEEMWDGSFKYETQEDKAYTMWFFDSINPNDNISRALGKLNSTGHTACHLRYYHKDTPGPEPDGFTECHPWKDSACCTHGTVETEQKLKEAYGKEYHWDRCGPLTSECERFFVQEACFYECDPNAGLFRKYAPHIYNKSNPNHNEWQMNGMPIKASYCDAWWQACRANKFCASDGGSFFSCAAEYKEADKTAELKVQLLTAQAQLSKVKESSEDEHTGLIIGFVSAGIAILGLTVCGIVLIVKERAGKPVFQKKLLDEPAESYASRGQAIGNTGI
eukprot:TRINITY_DN112914_c0_g1_i1.p1 TRINITY_DN112914_c0_g1~~TRINITY_DN112914_c0_g1_i1.p1  ORF type:complete len:318 (-),score=64.14 TRINITY_DN112914_c0_g1_i1:78-1031(-)